MPTHYAAVCLRLTFWAEVAHRLVLQF